MQHKEFISIHALREEGDDLTRCIRNYTQPFQSTPSVRRATEAGYVESLFSQDFNPRPP